MATSTAMATDPVARILAKMRFQTRMFFVISGAVLIHLSLGTYHTFGNMLPYMASYMRNYTDASIQHEQLIWIPTLQGSFPFAMVIGGYLASKLGPRKAASLGCLIMVSGVFLSSWAIRRSYYTFLFTYGFMFGLGQGIAYVIAVSCVINWAPQMVGFGSGIVAAGFGVSSSIFAPIQTKIINPDNLPPTRDGYFNDPELLQRVPGVFFTLSIVYCIMQFVGLIFICDPPPEDDSDIEPLEESFPQQQQDQEGSSDSDLEASKLGHQPSVSFTTGEMLRSSTFYFLFISLFCCSFYGNMFYNLYKTFGETFIADDFFLAMAFSVGSVANAIARIGWGLLTDKTSFQTSLTIATCLATILLLTMPMTAEAGQYVYLFWLIMMFVCLAATHALFITAIVRCFGSRYKIVNYGCLITSTTLSGILLAIGSEFYLQAIGYNWAFICTAAFPFTAFLLTSAIRITPQGHLIVSS